MLGRKRMCQWRKEENMQTIIRIVFFINSLPTSCFLFIMWVWLVNHCTWWLPVALFLYLTAFVIVKGTYSSVQASFWAVAANPDKHKWKFHLEKSVAHGKGIFKLHS